MIEPIKPSESIPVISSDSVPSQKLNTKQELIIPPVVRKGKTDSVQQDVSRQELEDRVEQINRLMGIFQKRLQFSVHEKSGRVMVKVIDQENGKIIDEIPPKQILDFFASFDQLIGLLVDKRA